MIVPASVEHFLASEVVEKVDMGLSSWVAKMAGNPSLTSTISSLPEPVTTNYELNLILGSGLADLGSLGILSLLALITTIIVFKSTVEAS